MALDHYVSQVHLRNFYSEGAGGRLYAIRKRDLKSFRPDSHSVCRIEEGSTNEYLQERRVVEEFLKGVEPRYNEAVARLTLPTFDHTALYSLSGFIAYVLCCSPAGMRLHSAPFRSVVEETARRLDAQGNFGAPPASLGGASFTELLENETIRVAVDPKYPQAVGISQILAMANTFGNFVWEVLVNDVDDSPYLTSDFPVAIEETPDPRIIARLVPLTPRIAVRLIPNLDAIDDARSTPDFTYTNFRRRVIRPTRNQIMAVNRQIVRGAEDVVFYSRDLPWVPRFVEKNASYRLETKTERIRHDGGTLLWSRLSLVERSAGAI